MLVVGGNLGPVEHLLSLLDLPVPSLQFIVLQQPGQRILDEVSVLQKQLLLLLTLHLCLRSHNVTIQAPFLQVSYWKQVYNGFQL